MEKLGQMDGSASWMLRGEVPAGTVGDKHCLLRPTTPRYLPTFHANVSLP